MKIKLAKKIILTAAILGMPLVFHPASAATLFMTPSTESIAAGNTFTVDVHVASEDQTVNAAQGTLSYSRDTLEVLSVSRTDSIFNIWLAEPTVSTSTGQIMFLGGSTNSFTGRAMQVFAVTLRARTSGRANISFSDAAVTAGDGTGANILTGSSPLTFTIGAAGAPVPVTPPTQITRPPVAATGLPAKPAVQVPLYPDPSKWYDVIAAWSANWQLPADVNGVAAVVNKTPAYNPAESEGLFTSKQFSELTDGIWYLHVRFRNSVGWGDTVNMRIAVDTVPPAAFSISSDEGASTLNPRPSVSFRSGDALSGIARYEVRVDGGAPLVSTTTAFTLPLQMPGEHQIRVRVVDMAGNSTESSAKISILPIDAPTISPASGSMFVGEGGLVVSGLTRPSQTVVLTLRDINQTETHYEGTAAADGNGNWTFRFDQPLHAGTYVFEARAQDARGAFSLPVESPPFVIHERPILTIGSLEITQTWFTALLAILLAAVFCGGLLFERLRSGRMRQRTVIAQRDVVSIAGIIKKEAEKCIKLLRSKNYTENELADLQSSARNVEENAEKLEKYVVGGIEEITK